MAQIEVLGALRHVCHSSGGCCQGNTVALRADEAARITAIGADLDIEHAVVESMLGQTAGRCLFLDPQKLCQIHSSLSPADKPSPCQQYPLVGIRTESGLRVGVDPGCLSAFKSWQTGPELESRSMIASVVRLPNDTAQIETKLLDILDSTGMTIGGVLSHLTGEHLQACAVPEAFAVRLWNHLVAQDLAARVSWPGTAEVYREHLVPVADAWRALSVEHIASWPTLNTKQTQWSLETARRMLHMRLAAHLYDPAAVALLTLSGAIACGWVSSDIETWGPRFATWTRALRSPVFKSMLFDAPGSFAALVRG